MKSKLYFAIALSLLVSAKCLAQDQRVDGNLTVTGTSVLNSQSTSGSGSVDFSGSTIYFGSWTSDDSQPGIVFNYSDALSSNGTSTFYSFANRFNNVWVWQKNSSTGALPMMQLDASNKLALFSTSGTASVIVLDPVQGQISINGQSLMTTSAANATYQGHLR